MSISVKLDRVLLDRGMSLTELSERVGVTIANLSMKATIACCINGITMPTNDDDDVAS